MKSNFLNTSENNNVFDFIHDKVSSGLEGWRYYLTDIGNYIVNGSPFYNDFNEWVENTYIYYDEYGYNSFEECPEIVKEEIQERYYEEITDWLTANNLKTDDLKMLDLLHLQYQAIEDYSKGIDIDNAKKTIAETKMATNKNCLEYLVSLKKLYGPISYEAGKYYWTSLLDKQGSELCAVLTGIDPALVFEEPSDERTELLSEMHNQFLHYKEVINELTKEQDTELLSDLDVYYYIKK